MRSLQPFTRSSFPALLLSLSAAGCPSEPGNPDSPRDAGIERPLPSTSTTHDASPPPSASAPAPIAPRDAIGPTPSDSAAPAFSGETWATCCAGFVPEGAPAKDVMRLGLLCGPYHGMREVRPSESAHLEKGQEHVRVVRARSGDCFRAMTVCDASMGTVELELARPDGSVALRSVPGRWSVLPARGAWCADSDGEYRLRAIAGGSGDLAMQVWLLP